MTAVDGPDRHALLQSAVSARSGISMHDNRPVMGNGKSLPEHIRRNRKAEFDAQAVKPEFMIFADKKGR